MDLFILKADNSKEMNSISQELSEKKFKTIQEESHYILMKKNRYGNYYVHILFLMIGLFYFYLALIVNVVYFTYSYLWASPHVWASHFASNLPRQAGGANPNRP